MAPSPLFTISLLAAGAAVGAGTAALLSSRPRKEVAHDVKVLPPSQPALPTSHTRSLETDLVDRRLLALAARQAGGALESSGYPGPVSDLLVHTAYISAYDRRLKHPAWTAAHLTAESLLKLPLAEGQKPPKADRSFSVFMEDERIPEQFRAKLSDYFKSGYDRGHMVAAADAKFSQQAMNETFYLTNIAPQVGEGFNRDYWAHTEDFVRRLTERFADVYVFTVPLYLPKKDLDGRWRVTYEVIGNPPSVSVPTHFAKVVLGVGRPSPAAIRSSLPSSLGASSSGNELSLSQPAPTPTPTPTPTPRGLAGNLVNEKWIGLGAFVIPNAPIPNEVPLKDFVVPVDSVERSAGLSLFPEPVKQSAKQLCSLVECSLVVRDFSDASKRMKRSNSAPAGLGISNSK